MVIVMGHRANTPRWIKRLMSEGADGVEIDFYCRNGVLYASHLSVIGRARLLRERIASLLTSLHILGPYPLKELIKNIPLGTPIMLDLKSGLEQQCVETLYEISQMFLTYVSLRDYDLSPMLAKRNIRVLLSMDHRPLNALGELEAADAKGVSINKKYVDEALVKQLHSHGYIIALWTINTLDEAVYAKKLNADIIVTDYPKLISHVLRKE